MKKHYHLTCALAVALLLISHVATAQSYTRKVRTILAAGADRSSLVTVYGTTTSTLGKVLAEFHAFDARFVGGVRVAVGDVNGDGFSDLIAGAGPGGGPHVKVFDGSQLEKGNPALLNSFSAFEETFRGGVNVAAGDVDGDGRAEVVVGADVGGGSHIKVITAADGSVKSSFFAFDPSFRGGVRVASGDIDGDGADELVAGAGPGGGPHVKVFSGAGAQLHAFTAFEPTFRGGIYVAAGDLDGDGVAEVIAGSGPGGGPHVKVFSGAGALQNSFFAYASTVRTGVRVGVGDPTGLRSSFESSCQRGANWPGLSILTGGGRGARVPLESFRLTPAENNVPAGVHEVGFGGLIPFGVLFNRGIFPNL